MAEPDPTSVASRLAAWLRPRLAALGEGNTGEVTVGALEPAAAGQSNDTALFRAWWTGGDRPRSGEFVLRRQPGANRLFDDADVIREFDVMAALQLRSRVPVPEMLWSEADAAVIGTPFFVMRRVAGRVPTARPSIHTAGWLPELSVAERGRLWSSALDVVVAVHETDWRDTHEWLAPGGDPTLEDRLAALARWYRWVTGGRSFPVTDAALDALRAEAPAVRAGDPVLVWGDARIGNMIVADDLRVAAAIDWELASIGPPEVDLGHWLFFDRFFTEGAGVEPLEGFPDRATTIARYEAASGRTLRNLEWFELMAETMVATTLIRQADLRVQAGLLPAGTGMGHGNAVTRMIAARLGLPVPRLDADYLAHRQSRSAPAASS
ncbi:phosphotransferase family protein [Acidiferrimicrobium sp. IK]|uniref:phosphotransferase family protein n=1 Tax=Acidiferrimicrobium sp. IK TaxID=2871700 RepID=UPI0021CAF3B8|nr:phosphotransferase family protein [Acidiferrimicrobium sp. IK]MCU4183467.1 phosphotransferase family protein [Acidiferrimicrobium sp. IK]